jgi:predicted alpha/beta hydrolase
MLLYWRLMPAVVRVAGYLPLRKLTGSGLDLPPGVALEWARWGLDPEHVRGYASRKDGARGYSGWAGKLRAYAIADDRFAPRAAVEKLASWFESAQRELRVVEPLSVGARGIGHFGFFQRRFRDTLWREAREWLLARAGEARPRRAASTR